MPLPSGIATVTVTGQNLCDLEGNPALFGTVHFKASGQLVDPTHGVIIANIDVIQPVSNGVMTPVVLPVNDSTVNPNGFTITVRQELFYGSSLTPVLSIYNISLDHTTEPSIDLSELIQVAPFTVVSGISIVNSGQIGQVLTNLGNNTANWQNPQASSTTFSRQIYIDMTGQPSIEVAPVGTWAPQYLLVTDTGNQFSGFITVSDGAQNDSVTYDFACGAGTYEIELRHLRFGSRGIYTVKVDGVTVGAVDGYVAGGAVIFTRSVLTGVAITAGQHTLTLAMLTKNASSSGYFGYVERAVLTQTG